MVGMFLLRHLITHVLVRGDEDVVRPVPIL